MPKHTSEAEDNEIKSLGLVKAAEALLKAERISDNLLNPCAGSYLVRFATAAKTSYACCSLGFCFATSAPTATRVFIISACSSAGRLITSPCSAQVWRCLAKKSTSQGLISAAALAASASTMVCRSLGSESNHFLLRKAIEKIKVWLASVTYCAASQKSEEHTSELQSPCNLVCRL